MKNFTEVNIPQSLLDRLNEIGFKEPTPIQSQAIPHALEGADILGSAQTGTGKTGAYGIPLISHLINGNSGSALVLLPTRELALQVIKALQEFLGTNKKIKSALLIGGEDMRRQFRQLQANPQLIVGTPGRINDHLTRGSLKLNNTKFLVLDEVDRMLDMGFGVQLEAISKYLTSKRQTLMFSATLPKNIQKLSNKYLVDPVRISVGSTHSPAKNVTQENIKLPESEKYTKLIEEIENRTGSIIVFTKTKYGADAMAKKIRKLGHKADALHGDLRQNKRTQVTAAFRDQKYRILIATDVAARGLDIPHIEHVINYDLPQSPEDYIHRIGRTARGEAKGAAVNFLSPADNIKWRAIQLLLNPDAKPESLGRGNAGKKSSGKRNFGKPAFGKPGFKKDFGKGRSSESRDGVQKKRKPQQWSRNKTSAA